MHFVLWARPRGVSKSSPISITFILIMTCLYFCRLSSGTSYNFYFSSFQRHETWNWTEKILYIETASLGLFRNARGLVLVLLSHLPVRSLHTSKFVGHESSSQCLWFFFITIQEIKVCRISIFAQPAESLTAWPINWLTEYRYCRIIYTIQSNLIFPIESTLLVRFTAIFTRFQKHDLTCY